MERQLKLELNSKNWGLVDHDRLIEWLESLPESTRVTLQRETTYSRYFVYVQDKNARERLILACMLSGFKDIQITRYIHGKVIGETLSKVQEKDLCFLEKWLIYQINKNSMRF